MLKAALLLTPKANIKTPLYLNYSHDQERSNGAVLVCTGAEPSRREGALSVSSAQPKRKK